MAMFLKKLQGKIFLITSVTIFILISLSFFFEHSNYKKLLYERIIIHMRENSFSIRTSIESAHDISDVQRILHVQRLLEGFVHMEEEEHATEDGEEDPYEIPPHEIHVVDKTGMITASTRPELRGIPIEEAMHHREASLHEVLKGRTAYAIEEMEHAGVKVIDMSIPIRRNGEIVGALHYVEPYVKLDRLIRDSFLQHAFFALALIISLSLSINYLIKKMVTKPLSDMSDAMDRIRLKGPIKDLPVSSKDEIGLLVQSFNEMSHSLKEREAEIHEHTVKLEETVKERTKKLEESHSHLLQSQKLASLGIIASGVAHEINNPLGGMFNCVQMLEQMGNDEEFRKRYLELFKDGLGRIENTVGKLLWMSRKKERAPQLVEIKHSLRNVYAFIDYMIKKNNVVYKENVEDSIAIVIDPNDLQQIFINLMINAVQSMKDGGTLSVHAFKSNGQVVLEVTDTGEGIEEESLDEIFNPFYTTKQPGEGTGLGLWLTNEIVENYNGEISVQSKKGEGTKFSIIFNSG